MKLIRITKCEECPHCRLYWGCTQFRKLKDNAIITDPSKIKDNCPLEDGE